MRSLNGQHATAVDVLWPSASAAPGTAEKRLHTLGRASHNLVLTVTLSLCAASLSQSGAAVEMALLVV